MSAANPKVDAFIGRATSWQAEMKELRKVLLGCGLGEELKWGKPCYTAEGGNIAIIQPFKAHLALMFFKGALLEDTKGMLKSQGENSRSARRMEFTDPQQVTRAKSDVEAFIRKAIAVEKAGLEVSGADVTEADFPEELKARLGADVAYRKAFEALTPGRRRSYLLHFTGAKQSKTRARRIDRCRARVLEGKGFNER